MSVITSLLDLSGEYKVEIKSILRSFIFLTTKPLPSSGISKVSNIKVAS